MTFAFARVAARNVVRFGQFAGQELMAGISHAAQIDLRLSDLAREVLDFRIGAGPGNLARKRFHLESARS